MTQTGHPRKTWWGCVKDMKRIGLTQDDVQFRNKWRRGNRLSEVNLEKWPLKRRV